MTQIPIETQIMFAIPLGVTKIPKEICDVLKDLKGTAQHGYQHKPSDFEVLKNYPEVEKGITDVFTVWVNNILMLENQQWKMTTHWITENADGAAMTRHRHLNCNYSAILYFDKVDEKNHSNLIIENPLKTIWGDIFTPNKDGGNIFNSYEYGAPMEQGTMIMFPSYCYHLHVEFESLIKRRSLACNFHPIGKYGNADSSLDTNWLAHDG